MHAPSQRIDLFETRRGLVFYCPRCEALHVQMGNAVMTCGASEFDEFRAAVSRSCDDVDQARARDQTHMICWDSLSMGFAFNTGELLELRFLVDGASAVLALNTHVREALQSDTQ